ncbi:YopT-type cysteine protease domain-containing protein [Noviherbaspirillum saxi]|uniref:Peptidase C58 YopT-type domain-containing protein n=1 Tax=Noviherbaspirillum saxi TaxID=2320863 RepID=A0A3A3FFL6_9BURK|nr:YopT-type cysteine protease domain-containing protein [Noviherbaspirillum saxi]RJF92146.1 hypothetical protein D3871_26245 [Noviherbaspirillum saxi]
MKLTDRRETGVAQTSSSCEDRGGGIAGLSIAYAEFSNASVRDVTPSSPVRERLFNLSENLRSTCGDSSHICYFATESATPSHTPICSTDLMPEQIAALKIQGKGDEQKREMQRTSQRYETLRNTIATSTIAKKARAENADELDHDNPAALFEEDLENKTSHELKNLYVNNFSSYTHLQKSVLSVLIKNKEDQEHLVGIFKLTLENTEKLQKHGATDIRLIPQDFYLTLTNAAQGGGRCLPLVRMVATAEMNGGCTNFFDNLYFAAADPEGEKATILREGLASLHSNVGAIQAECDVDSLNVKEIVNTLERLGSGACLSLLTSNHAMLVVSTMDAGKKAYMFYDPNFAKATFTSSQDLENYLDHHFSDFHTVYGMETKNGKNTLTVKQIDAQKMHAVIEGCGLRTLL